MGLLPVVIVEGHNGVAPHNRISIIIIAFVIINSIEIGSTIPVDLDAGIPSLGAEQMLLLTLLFDI